MDYKKGKEWRAELWLEYKELRTCVMSRDFTRESDAHRKVNLWMKELDKNLHPVLVRGNVYSLLFTESNCFGEDPDKEENDD